jgi:cytochrome P450
MAITPKSLGKALADVPGPAPLPIMGNLMDFLTMEVHERFYEYSLAYGDMVKFYIFKRPALLINSPELLEQVMITDRDRYFKQTPTTAFRPIVRQSIFIANKPEWTFGREHHPYTRDYAPSFLEGMIPAVVNATRAIMTERVTYHHGRPFDLYQELVYTVFQSFSSAVLGQRVSDAVYRDFLVVMAEGAVRLKTGLPSINPRFWLSLKRWFRFLQKQINNHRERTRPEAPKDVLDYVTRCGTSLPDGELLDEVSTMLTGGVHPVATALAAIYYLGSKHPEAAAKMTEEVHRGVYEKEGAPFTLQQIDELTQLDYFIKEALRLYSPVAVITRAVMPGEPVCLKSVTIPETTEVFMSSWAMQRSAKYWDNPMCFEPERFKTEPSPLIFFPFGIGERTCAGKAFAQACLKLTLTVLLSEFDITLDASGPLRTTMSTGFIKPKGQIKARITLRRS